MNGERLARPCWWPILGCVIVIVVWIWWWPCAWPYRARPITTVFVVRHADKASPSADALDDPLGIARAAELARVLADAGVEAIYHSDTVRAQQTAAPLAGALGLAPIEYPAPDVAALVDALLADHRGERVLVVGHSNTVPDIVEELGGPASADLAESDHDDLLVVTLCPCSGDSPSIVRLEYGADTTP